MNRITMAMNTPPGSPIQLQNYDVLLVPSADDEPLRFAPGNHVGNERFRILLSLYRQRYLQASMLGDEFECMTIAQEVFDTVCTKCVPSGRFYQQICDDNETTTSNKRWKQFQRDSPTTISTLRRALRHDPMEGSSITEERAPKRLKRTASSLGFELLYKAASKSLPTSAPQELVDEPSHFDVVCQANGNGISQDRKYTGNNRLKIMFDIRMTSYKTSTPDGKRSIAEEIVTSIMDDTSSRFLQPDPASGKYRALSRIAAQSCIKNALDQTTGIERKQYRDNEVKKLVQRRQKKAILDRIEKRKGRVTNVKPDAAGSAPLPTTFNAFLRRNSFVAKSA